MSKAALSIRYFGVYLMVLGLIVLFLPGTLLGIFAIAEPREVWIRVAGLLVFNVGVYYWFAAGAEATSFFRASIFTRSLILVGFIAFVVLGWAPATLILLAVPDFLGGLWTAWALKQGNTGALSMR